MIELSKDLLQSEMERMKSQLFWSLTNFYKHPLDDQGLTWLNLYIFWTVQISIMEEMIKRARE